MATILKNLIIKLKKFKAVIILYAPLYKKVGRSFTVFFFIYIIIFLIFGLLQDDIQNASNPGEHWFSNFANSSNGETFVKSIIAYLKK